MARNRARRTTGDRPRGKGERGAVLVEMAFTLPILCALLFGIIDFGYAFNDWISVRQGGRDGLRQAIVNTAPTAPACTGVGTGAPAAGTDGNKIMCFTKNRVGLDFTNTRVKVYFVPTSGTLAAGQPMKLCVQYKTSSLTGAYSAILTNKVLDTEVESLNEQATTMAPFQEDPVVTGGSWPASCSTL